MKNTKQQQNITSLYSVAEYINVLITNSAHLNQSSALLEKACQYVWDAQDVDSELPDLSSRYLILRNIAQLRRKLTDRVVLFFFVLFGIY